MPKAKISAFEVSPDDESSHSVESKKTGCLGAVLKIFLWICFFPIMFTIWAIKQQRFNKRVKVALIAAAWVLFVIVVGCSSAESSKLAQERALDFNAVEMTGEEAVVRADATNNSTSRWSSTAYLVVHYENGDEKKLSFTISCDEGSSVEVASSGFAVDGVSGFEADYTGAQITYSNGELIDLLNAEKERVAAEEERAAAEEAKKKAEEEAAEAKRKAEEEAAAQQKAEEEAAAAAAAEAEAQRKAEEEAAAQAEAQAQAEADAAAAAEAREEERKNETVYITATGKKYHSRTGCSGLNNAKSVSETTLGQAEAMGLTPCAKCH